MVYYDHFHCVFEHEGQSREIEGGCNGFPEGWDSMSEAERKEYLKNMAVAWGMPEGATIKRFWLAG